MPEEMSSHVLRGALCAALVLMIASGAFAADPYLIYDEVGLGSAGGNIYYCSAVVGDTVYTGQISRCAEQWGDQQINGTALLNHTPDGFTATPPPAANNIAKASLPLGGYIYMVNGGGFLYRTADWACTNGLNLVTGVPAVSECIATDGTYIYMTSGQSSDYYKVHKLAVDHVNGSVSEVAGWPVTIEGSTVRFRGVSYYNGKLYVANFKAAGQVYEIDAETGAFTQIATCATAADSNYQVARYGNDMFIVGLNCNLYKYTLSGGTWSLSDTDQLFPPPGGAYGCYGIAVKGDGTTAKYAWVTHQASRMSFWALDPWAGEPTGLGQAFSKQGYPANISGAVVSHVGTDGFWAQDKGRAAAAHVLWSGTMPAVNSTVLIQGGTGKTDSGERVINAATVQPEASFDAVPLFVQNGKMGPATGSAGQATDGLLVTVWGRVTSYDFYTNIMYIDDGSNVVSDLPGVNGVKVILVGFEVPGLFDQLFPNLLPTYATVTGIARLEKTGDGSIIRRVDARSDAEVILTAF